MIKMEIKHDTKLRVNTSYEAKTLEDTMEELTTLKQPVEATSPIIYTDRKDGVRPEYDIRTDRWEIAQEAMDYVSKTKIAKREGTQEPEKGEIGKTEPIQGTEKE